MKNIQNKLIVLLFLTFAFPPPGSSQDHATPALQYEVNRVYPSISITKEQLNEAHTLKDINRLYESSWIKEYISVEILTTYKGNIIKSVSNNDSLSQAQKDLLNRADAGTDISVNVQYMPENTLKQNDAKEIHFTFKVDPENEATYPGGMEPLKQYLKDHAIDKIPDGSFKHYDVAAIQFTIGEEGEIIDAHVFNSVYQTANNEKIDELLLETIRNMPRWQPATYANGTKVKQEFVLTVGNMESCLINLLNIQKMD